MKNNKKLLGLLTAVSALGLATAASAAGAVNSSATSSATISAAVSLTKTTNMAFGSIIKPTTGSNTVTLSNSGGVTLSGAGDGSVVVGSTKTSAVFALVAPVGTTYTVTPTLTLAGLTSPTADSTYAVDVGSAGAIPAGGTQSLSFGGSFIIDSSTAVQAYNGTLALTVSYN